MCFLKTVSDLSEVVVCIFPMVTVSLSTDIYYVKMKNTLELLRTDTG